MDEFDDEALSVHDFSFQRAKDDSTTAVLPDTGRSVSANRSRPLGLETRPLPQTRRSFGSRRSGSGQSIS